MKRRDFLKTLPLFALSSCALARYARIDPWHVLVRSDVIESLEQEAAVTAKASLGWTSDGRIRVLHVRGTPYERGYQHGKLLRNEVQANLGYLYRQSLKKFQQAEIFAEAYERMRPFIPVEYIEEMHGLAHGARMPLEVIHAIHALPSMTEWGGKKKLKKVIQRMMDGDLATSCSNIGATGAATADGETYALRVLDWGLHRISKLHKYPLLTVNHPEGGGLASVNVGWVGFLGAVSGMNAAGITLGEMGYGDPEGETMRGRPMPFLLRDVMTQSHNLADVRRIIKDSPGDNSFVFLMTDGKSGDTEIYLKDHDRFVVTAQGTRLQDRNNDIPAVAQCSYGGHYNDRMTEVMNQYHGKLSPELFMKVIVPKIAMPSNFQNVIYRPGKLQLWVANAKDFQNRAAEQPYTFFDLGEALR